MLRWWWQRSLEPWKRCIRGELIWGSDALRAVTSRRCGHCGVILGRPAMISRRCWPNCERYLDPEQPGQAVKAIPGQGSNVPITLLGSSGFSAQLAGSLGLPFAFAAHFAPDYLYVAAQLYRDHFRHRAELREPYFMVGVQIIAAETDAEARRLFTTPQQRFLRLIRNQPVELLPPVDSMEPLWEDWERAAVINKLRAAIVGSDATVKAGLERLVGETGASEVIVVTDTYEPADRLESYRRVAGVAATVDIRRDAVVGA